MPGSPEAACSCQVCVSLIEQVWRGVSGWIDATSSSYPPTRASVAKLGVEMCEVEVPNEVLSAWMVKEIPAGSEDGSLPRFRMAERTSHAVTLREMEAVRASCMALWDPDHALSPHEAAEVAREETEAVERASVLATAAGDGENPLRGPALEDGNRGEEGADAAGGRDAGAADGLERPEGGEGAERVAAAGAAAADGALGVADVSAAAAGGSATTATAAAAAADGSASSTSADPRATPSRDGRSSVSERIGGLDGPTGVSLASGGPADSHSAAYPRASGSPRRELPPLLDAVVHAAAEYASVIPSLPETGKEPSLPPALSDPRGPRADRECYDRHPQCRFWARAGECDANPAYMVGAGPDAPGHCRLACGICKPATSAFSAVKMARGARLGARATAQAERAAAADAARLRLVREQCLRGPSCAADLEADRAHLDALDVRRGVAAAGAAGAAGGAAAGAAAGGDARSDGGAGRGGGGLPGGEAERGADRASVSTAPLEALRESSKALMRRSWDDAVVRGEPSDREAWRDARRPPRTGGLFWRGSDPPAGTPPGAAPRTCVYASTGYWMYEICLGWRIVQFHMTEGHRVDWAILLGSFQRDVEDVAGPRRTALDPGGPARAASLVSSYASGDECELGVEDARVERRISGRLATGGVPADLAGALPEPVLPSTRAADTVARAAELVVFCSIDADTHVVVREPRRCRYVVELFLPEACGRHPALEGHEEL